MSQLSEVNDSLQYSHLRRHNAIECGRADALDLFVKGKPLYDVLGQLIHSMETSTQGLKCSVMLLDEESNTLSPFIGPSLPAEFLAILQGVPVDIHSCTCGAAVYARQPMFAEDITLHPNWSNYSEVANRCEIRACWSQPIISIAGHVFGTFSMYFSDPKVPEQDDKESLEYEAKIIALILERSRNIDQLDDANILLEQRVAERTKELTQTNILLSKVLSQRNDVRKQLLEKENLAALGIMMSSLTHELSTPTGVAITAASYLSDILKKSQTAYNNNQLKRADLTKVYQNAIESAEIIERNLVHSTQLIASFKRLSIDQHNREIRLINMCDYLDNILLSLKPHLKRTQHKFCLDIDPDLTFISNAGAISQILTNLIVNSVLHGFTQDIGGRINIKVRLIAEEFGGPIVQFVYTDNGKGMSEQTLNGLYEPFFTTARDKGGSGLGMHICHNLVIKELLGHIVCKSKLNEGVNFTITFPVSIPENSSTES